MKRITTRAGWLLACAALAGCAANARGDSAANPARAAHGDAHSLAQAACAGCHSVERYGLSPNPAAPEFPMIANTRGLTVASLTTWLRDAHNYPEEMDFYLEDDEVAQLVRYILTLKDEDYRPPM